MIKSIDIKNFQPHKDTHMDFSPGVNAIVGTSDKGKSSVFRAFDFNIRNTTNDKAYVSHWCYNKKGNIVDNSEVTINLDDHIIKRVKGKDNYYNVDNEETNQEGIGKGTPPDNIIELYKMDDITMQKQKDSFFLFDLSKTKVAETFNKIVDLEIIDTTINNIKSKIREIKNEEKVLNNKKEEYQKEVESYNYIDDIAKELQELQILENEIDMLNSSIADLDSSITVLNNYDIQLENINNILSTEKEINNLIIFNEENKILLQEEVILSNTINTIEDVNVKLNNISFPDITEIVYLENSLREQKELNKNINDINTIVQTLNDIEKNLDIIKIPNDKIIQIAIDVYNNISVLSTEINALDNIINEYTELTERIVKGEEYIEDAKQELHNLMNRIGICPLCGQSLKGVLIE